MASFKYSGLDDYIKSLERIGPKGSVGVLKYAVFEGAKIAADALREEIEMNHSASGDLARSLTLTKMRNESGYINTSISFAGYDHKGVPNALKAAVLESGRSDRKGTHFISKTLKSVRPAVEEAMSNALDKKIEEIMEE